MYKTLPQMLKDRAELHPDVSAQYYKSGKSDFLQISFKELYQISLDFGAGLLSIGVVREDHIGLISDNRKEWQQADMGIMAIGAIDVPRGCCVTVSVKNITEDDVDVVNANLIVDRVA